MNFNTLLSLLNFFQLRGIRSDLAKLTAGPAPMPVTDLCPELYERPAGFTPPPQAPAAPRCLPPGVSLAHFLQGQAMDVMAGRSDEHLRQMRRDLDAIEAVFEQEIADAAIRRLEMQINS